MRLKYLYRTLVLMIVSIFFISLLSLSAFAKGSADITIPSTAVETGSDCSVTVKFTADEQIGFITGMISYDDNILEFQPSDNVSGGGGVLNINAFPDSPSKDLTVKVNFKALSSGKCQLDLSNCYITSDDGSQLGSPTAYGRITVSGNAINNSIGTDSSDEEKIGDPQKGYLTSLTVSKGKLKPEFSYDIYDYTVDVEYEVDFLEIEGTTANANDRIWYTGNEDLAVGKNVRTVRVTDAQGYNHVYTITINRAENPNPSSQEVESSFVETDTSSKSSDSAPVIVDSDNEDFFSKNKGIITTGLIIVLATLILAAVVIIAWFKKKKK